MSCILLVEDDLDTAKIIRRYLEQDGYVLEHSQDGLSGLNKALNNPPDLIILDWMLPKLNGPEVPKQLRQELLNWAK